MKIIDLFCGCGGLSLGLERAGFEITWACDHWDKAVAVYRANFNHPVEQADISDVAKINAKIASKDFDGIVGGPPCQDFSSAGKRTEGDRADLTDAFAKIVVGSKPRFFIMENVPRARLSQAYQKARTILKGAGYGLTEVTLDASYCGVPQKRKRFFCIGIKGGLDGALNDTIVSRLSAKPLTVAEYLGAELPLKFYYRHPRNYSRRAIYAVSEPAATVRGVNRPVPSGYPGHPNDAAKLHRSIRALTTEERSRIQTFPPSFRWDAAKTHLELMIGNAVPVELARFVGECVKDALVESSEKGELENA